VIRAYNTMAVRWDGVKFYCHTVAIFCHFRLPIVTSNFLWMTAEVELRSLRLAAVHTSSGQWEWPSCQKSFLTF